MKLLKDGSTIGYHYLVGDKEVWQFLEDDVATSHTGTPFGNKNSIGVERLICEGVNYEHAIHNQAKLVATLMLKHHIPIQNVLTHKEMQIVAENYEMFEKAGFDTIGLVEFDKDAADTLKLNRPEWNVIHDDIANISCIDLIFPHQ